MDKPHTWHYGLVARWWAEFNEPDPDELFEHLARWLRKHSPHGALKALLQRIERLRET